MAVYGGKNHLELKNIEKFHPFIIGVKKPQVLIYSAIYRIFIGAVTHVHSTKNNCFFQAHLQIGALI